MEILFLLIPLSLVLAFCIGAAVWLAVDGGQFDDLDRPALDVIADDDRPGHDAEADRRDHAIPARLYRD